MEAKAMKAAAIRAQRWSKHQVVNFGGVDFASDDTAAVRLTAAITARQTAQALGLEGVDDEKGWEALDGSYVPMTLNGLRQLLLTGVAKTQACFDRQTALLAACAAAADAEALEDLDIEVGWP